MTLIEIASCARYKKNSDMASVSARFWKWVDKTDSCWLWTGALRYGYGRFVVGGRNGKVLMSHRFAYEEIKGVVPEGLQLDHLCRVRNCVNPDHLEPVTQKVNILRGESPSAKQARQTHCIHGHLLSGDNLYEGKNNHRGCKICRSHSMKKFLDNKKQKFSAEVDLLVKSIIEKRK